MPVAQIHSRASWRGVETCVRADAMLTGMVAVLTVQGHADIAAGLLLSQGSYQPPTKFSSRTHCGCGVVDISRFNRITGALWMAAEWALIIRAARMVGFAAWHRPAIKGLWVEHAHLVAIGCPELDPEAVAQVSDYLRGLDGLASRGPDTGPRDWAHATWEQHAASPQAPIITERKTGMILIQSPGRNPALIDAGYSKELTTQVEKDCGAAMAAIVLSLNDLQWDTCLNLATSGNLIPSVGEITDPKALADALAALIPDAIATEVVDQIGAAITSRKA